MNNFHYLTKNNTKITSRIEKQNKTKFVTVIIKFFFLTMISDKKKTLVIKKLLTKILLLKKILVGIERGENELKFLDFTLRRGSVSAR